MLSRSTPSSPFEGKPFLKWAGGKWRIAPDILELLPKDLTSRTYREPFLGGGGMYFYLARHARPKRCFLSDTLDDLIATYKVVASDTAGLIKELERLEQGHSSESFYVVRERFNTERAASKVERAAWLIYLNKTCFNGLFRTNSKGLFNVPIGRFSDPNILDEPRLRAAAAALKGVTLSTKSFDHLEEVARAGDVIYFDPPYVPLSRSANFAAYADGGFGPEDQERLAALFRTLAARKCLLALSNSDTPDVRKLYKGFDIREIVAERHISSKITERKPVSEVLVRNV